MDPALVFPALTAAISALFWLYVRELQAQNRAKDERIRTLEEKVEKQADVIQRNTEALGKNAQSQEQIVAMLRTVLPTRDGGA